LKKFKQAEPYYLEAIAISDKCLSDQRIQKLAMVNQYRAYLLERYGEQEGGKMDDEFMKNRFNKIPSAAKRNILNGMALRLGKPSYTSEASSVGARGEVEVEVMVNEDGKVVRANAVSGHPILRPLAEQAAKASVFLPTYADGKKVIVTGVIVYNFK
jgi:hypothetical protein